VSTVISGIDGIDGIDGTGEATRWHVRASSISETAQKLSQIWSSVARDAQKGILSDGMRAAVRGDPHLQGIIDQTDELRIRTRTSVLTLVVVAPAAETAERAMATVSALAARHPSRSIVLSPSDPDGPTTFDAHIYAACQVRSQSEICTEEILIKVGGELSQHLATAVAPLLIHDLPVVVWWPDDVPFGSKHFVELAEEADRLLEDSGQFRGDGVERLVGLRQVVADGLVVHDIGWMRGMLWRELLAGIFDHPLLTRELTSIRSVRIDIAKPGRTVRLARAATFAGWLAAMLEWSVAEPMTPDGDSFRGAFRVGKREIPVEFRPVTAGIDGSIRSAGSLVRVELESSHARATTRVRVTRQSDHLLATADWNAAQVARRAARLDPFDEMPFLAEALDRTGHDRTFEKALDRGVKLMAAMSAPESSRAAGAAGAPPSSAAGA
jgi:glucose-6-phosphate dehydrogenase assembly protein OpcA